MDDKKYVVEIRETLIKQISINANNSDDAMSLIQKKYYDGAIILDSDNFSDVDFVVSE